MVKRRTLVVFLGCSSFLGGCDDHITQPKIVQLRHDEADSTIPTGDGGHVVPPPKCDGKCCPDPKTAPECYPGGKNPSDYSGAECLAQRDNTGADHWQLRQTMSISTKPPGNADSLLGGVLIQRSELHSDSCSTSNGTGGFIQLVDFDKTNGTGVATTGFAAYVYEQSQALADGLCFVEGVYSDDQRAIPALYEPPQGWPKGLPKPQTFPWQIKPVRAARYAEDFDVNAQRETILARLDAGSDGDLAKQGYNGIFFLDEKRGYMHGYAPLGYVVTYDSTNGRATGYNAIPIREAEITSQINDPDHPNCSGVYGTNTKLPATCGSTTGVPAWSCPPGNCSSGVLGPTKVQGYFLTVEAEQVYISALSQTLCYRFPLPDPYPGWNLKSTCRDDPKWNPTDSVNGIPPGDWCATTNSPATKDCHDAWQSISYSTFQAFPIQVGTTCPPM